ncbi:MAG: RNA polymerase sigma factor [Rhodothermales bacterium]
MAHTTSETPDEVLVVAAILGNFDAFNELVTRYRAAVVRTAQTIVSAADAEDVAQDALLLAFKALPSIEEPSKFASWLMVITRHRALRFNKQERKHRDRHVALDEVLLEQMGALSEPLAQQQEINEEVTLALNAISEEYALVLRLRFLDGVPLKRIAAFLDVPVSTVKWRVHQGKKVLRQQLERYRLPDTPWKEN